MLRATNFSKLLVLLDCVAKEIYPCYLLTTCKGRLLYRRSLYICTGIIHVQMMFVQLLAISANAIYWSMDTIYTVMEHVAKLLISLDTKGHERVIGCTQKKWNVIFITLDKSSKQTLKKRKLNIDLA